MKAGNGKKMGRMRRDQQPGVYPYNLPRHVHHDFALFGVNQNRATRTVFHHSTVIRDVVDKISKTGNFTPGRKHFCKSGQTTKTTCGQIKKYYYKKRAGSYVYHGVVCAGMKSGPGDSGGAMFHKRTTDDIRGFYTAAAAGVTVLVGRNTCFEPINEVERLTNSHVKLKH